MKIFRRRAGKKISRILMVFFVLFSLFPGWPLNYRPINNVIPRTEKATAADFQIKTGTYVGAGAVTTTISGIGFQPDFIIVKADKTETNSGMFYTSSMGAVGGAYFGSAIINSSTAFTGVYSDGFYVGPNNGDTNVNLVVYQYVAIKGTTSNFSVGTYSGNGADDRSVSVGFQPDLVITKANATTAAVWRSSAMAGDISHYFTTTASSTNLIQSLDVSGFTLGSDNAVNASGVDFYYVAMKNDASTFNVGTYTGNNTDNRDIAGIGFKPNLVWTKSVANKVAVMRSDRHQGDSSNTFTNGGLAANKIQAIGSDVFQVGTDASVNANNEIYYYVAFGGYVPNVSGSFAWNTGYYIGSGTSGVITGIGFKPDMVLIKSETTAGAMAFKSSVIGGANAVPLSNVAAGVTYITSFDSDGFSVGASDVTNKIGVLYQWMAYSGVDKADFEIGAYTGDGVDGRQLNVGFQPDLVWVKSSANQHGAWYSSATSSDWSNYFANFAGGADIIQQLNSTGFQIGTNAAVNTAATTYFYVAFKSSASKLKVGTYVGDGQDSRDITGVGFQPDAVFTKSIVDSTNRTTVYRTREHQGDSAAALSTSINNSVDIIQSFGSDSFQLGTSVYSNSSGKVYHYFVFGGANAKSIKSGQYYYKSGTYTGNGTTVNITGIGFVPDLIVIKDTSTGKSVLKTAQMNDSVAMSFAFAGAQAINMVSINPTVKGFSVGGDANVNTNNSTYYWYAFGNSGCGGFKIGAYAGVGSGGDNRNILGLGFQPDLMAGVTISSNLGVWRSSYWSGDSAMRFYNTASSTDLIQSVLTDGFQIGGGLAINPTNGTAVVYFAFKNVDGYFTVGGYGGDGNDNTDITTVGFQPNLVWIKSATDVSGAVHRTSDIPGDNTPYFMAQANAANMIQSFLSNGFQVGNGAGVNNNAVNYYWAAWKQIPPDMQQINYRWRNDNGSESTATFEAVENTPVSAVPKTTLKRLRVEVANKGSSGNTSDYLLEYGVKETTCTAIENWTAVTTTAISEHWQLADSSNLTNGEATTNVSGGLTDENSTFVAGKVLDTNYSSGNLTVDPGEFTEIEYSIQATANALGGANYCFRLSNSGSTANFTYSVYPEASLISGAVAISITTDGVVSFGAVDFNVTTSTDASGAETVRVDSGPANLSIRSTDFSSGTSTWSLGTVNGFDQVKFEYATSTNPNWTTFSASGTLYMVDNNVAQDSTRDIRLQITMPTSSLNYTQFSSSLTIVATAP